MMTRSERQEQAAAYTRLCESVRMQPGVGDIGNLSKSHLAQLFNGERLEAALYLRGVALRSKMKKVEVLA